MPTKTIIVCSNCNKEQCDGSIWKKIKVVEYEQRKVREYFQEPTGIEIEIDLSNRSEESLINCSLGTGRYKFLKNKKLGDEVRLEYDNWVTPAWVLVKKIED